MNAVSTIIPISTGNPEARCVFTSVGSWTFTRRQSAMAKGRADIRTAASGWREQSSSR